MAKTKTAKMLYGCGANSYYAIKMDVPDPYLWYQDTKGKTHVIMSPLEVDRTRKNAKVDHVHAMSDVVEALQEQGKPINQTTQALWLIEQDKPEVVEVPRDFPFALAQGVAEAGFKVEAAQGFFFPERALKTREEVDMIREAQALNEQAFKRAFEVLREATIGNDGYIYWQNEILTAEILRGQMNAVIAAGGGMPSDLIVACGEQGADPHERGHGPLKANELIIIDSWPRGPSGNFYHGDLTRTVLKGKASLEQQKLFDAVKDGQELALSLISAGVLGKEVHEAIDTLFAKRGFKTGLDDEGRNVGFFHGTGHSVGLEVHDEGPGISKGRPTDRNQPAPLEAGLVVTVEPGLYYPGIGGARIEDIVHVTKDGIENLTDLPKELVIP